MLAFFGPEGRRPGSSRFRPRVDALEGRALLATFAVTNTSGDAATAGSLPWAVARANAARGPDAIDFRIPGAGPHAITVGTPMFVTDQVMIDGATQPGYAGSPLVTIRGDGRAAGLIILTSEPTLGTASSGSTVRGLAFVDFTQNGVTIETTSSNNTVADNWVGFARDASGAVKLTSVAFPPPTYYTIGVGVLSAGNTIRNNTVSGVYNGIVLLSGDGTSVERNTVAGNRVGTDPTGTTAAGYGNLSDGIFLDKDARNNVIGPDNVASGNASAGIELLHQDNVGNLVFNNKVGTDAAGTAAIGNGEVGIILAPGPGNTGKPRGNVVRGNLVSGNRLGGIVLGTPEWGGTDENTVEGNVVGLDAAGTAALGSQETGITVAIGSNRNVVRDNVIAGNTFHGVLLAGRTDPSGALLARSSDNRVVENRIGLNRAGAAIPNGGYAVLLLAGADGNTIAGNRLGTNLQGAVHVTAQASGNAIADNSGGEPVGPAVSRARLVVRRGRVRRIVLTLGRAVDPGVAGRLDGYRLDEAGPDGRPGTADDRPAALRGASYSAASNEVVLLPRGQLRKAALKHRLTVTGLPGGSVAFDLTRRGVQAV